MSAVVAPSVSVEGCCMSGVGLDKRTYLPGVVMRSSCPKCAAPYVLNLGDHYLSYPEVGVPYPLTACCDACEHEWFLCSIIVRMTVEVVSVTWDNATTTDGEWSGLSLVIDTDTYAGNIEREMLAACTGVVIDEPTVILEEIASEYDGPDLHHLVTGDAEAYVTPGWSIAASGERHRVSPEHPFRMPTLSSVHIPLRDEPAADVLDGIKRRALAFAAAGMVDADGYVRIAPLRVTGFRMIRERVTTQSRDV